MLSKARIVPRMPKKDQRRKIRSMSCRVEKMPLGSPSSRRRRGGTTRPPPRASHGLMNSQVRALQHTICTDHDLFLLRRYLRIHATRLRARIDRTAITHTWLRGSIRQATSHELRFSSFFFFFFFFPPRASVAFRDVKAVCQKLILAANLQKAQD